MLARLLVLCFGRSFSRLEGPGSCIEDRVKVLETLKSEREELEIQIGSSGLSEMP